jgi:hypothetical protein
VDAVSLQDLHDLAQVKARYCRLVDTKQWDAWQALFTEDARFEVSPKGDTIGRDAFVPMVIGMVGEMSTVHQCQMPELTLTAADEARGIWSYRYQLEWGDSAPALPFNQRPGQHGYVEFGHYEETYARRDGTWRIAFLRTSPLAGYALTDAGVVALAVAGGPQRRAEAP